MVLKIKKKKDGRIILITILVLILLAIVGYIFYDKNNDRKIIGSLSTKVIPVELPTDAFPYFYFSPVPEIDLENSFLNHPKFLNLKQNGKLPVEPGLLGRSNPFLPFNTTTNEIDLD